MPRRDKRKQEHVEFSFDHEDYIPRQKGRRNDPFAGATIELGHSLEETIKKTVEAFRKGAPGVKCNMEVKHHKNFHPTTGQPVGTAMTSTPHTFMMTRGTKKKGGAYGDYNNMPELRYGADVDKIINNVANEMGWKRFQWTGKSNPEQDRRWRYSADADQALTGDTGKCSAYVARMAQTYPGLQK